MMKCPNNGDYLDFVKWYITSTLEENKEREIKEFKKCNLDTKMSEKMYNACIEYVDKLIEIARTVDYSSLYN